MATLREDSPYDRSQGRSHARASSTIVLGVDQEYYLAEHRTRERILEIHVHSSYKIPIFLVMKFGIHTRATNIHCKMRMALRWLNEFALLQILETIFLYLGHCQLSKGVVGGQ